MTSSTKLADRCSLHETAPEHRQPDSSTCVFCRESLADEVLATEQYAFAVLDGFPVTPGHALVLPIRHIKSVFELTAEEQTSCWRLIHLLRQRMLREDDAITGFNVGANDGETAGQTVGHAHIHLIPRRDGDSDAPRGGVRGVIPQRMSY